MRFILPSMAGLRSVKHLQPAATVFSMFSSLRAQFNTTEKRIRAPAFIFVVLFLLAGCDSQQPEVLPDNGWEALLDRDLSKWDKFIGVPHSSVYLPGYPKGDGISGTPIGLNHDPLQVFKLEGIIGQEQLRVSGEIYGGLSTKKVYGNYHLKLEFKWGEKVYPPRLGMKRDTGILYHATGAHGKVWNAWMESQEMQVQEGDMGDYIGLNTAIMDIRSAYRNVEGFLDWQYDPSSDFHEFGAVGVSSYCKRAKNHEKPHGEWNTLELICLDRKSLHIVNGQVVIVLENSRMKQTDGRTAPLCKGKIQIQSEGAEAYYRNIQIRSITEIPSEYH